VVDYLVEIIIPIITAAGGAIGGGVGVLLVRRFMPKKRHSDKEIFKHWRDNAFNRRAFKGPVSYEAANFQEPQAQEFHEAIEDTVVCIQTGICRRGHIAINKGEGYGYSSIKRKEWKEKMVDIEKRLEHIEYIMKNSKNHPNDGERREIDSERDIIIGTLNKIWSSNSIEKMRLPTEFPPYGSK
jgi:hypothetical protein